MAREARRRESGYSGSDRGCFAGHRHAVAGPPLRAGPRRRGRSQRGASGRDVRARSRRSRTDSGPGAAAQGTR
ncbi:hypothetical protein E4J89_11945 [Arthrobacter sp. CAU 1506]|nr:hypothetical protein E4J89_11945 [Arthrobacter sp. CAU 1506]